MNAIRPSRMLARIAAARIAAVRIAVARIAVALAVAAALGAPAMAHGRDDDRGGIVLNGQINTSDFTGGVGAGQYADECCYDGGYGGYAMAGMGSAGAMHAASVFGFMRAHAFAGAFAQAHAFAQARAFAHAGGMGHGHR